MAAPTKGLSSLVWEVVAYVIPFRSTFIRFDKKGISSEIWLVIKYHYLKPGMALIGIFFVTVRYYMRK
jgi:hypothetical protein